MMNRLFGVPFSMMGEYEEIQGVLEKRQGVVEIEGCVEAQKPHLIWGFGYPGLCRLVISHDETRARELMSDYSIYGKKACYFPARDLIFYQADIKGNLLAKERMEAVKAVFEEDDITLFTTIDALLEHIAPPNEIYDNILLLRVGDTFKIETLTKILVKNGYEKVGRVEDAGQFTVRGGIVDVWGLTEDAPFRIEYFDEDIDSIRRFDAESQRSIEELDRAEIFPAGEMILSAGKKAEGLARILEDGKRAEKALTDNFNTEGAAGIRKLVGRLKEDIEEGFDTLLDTYMDYFFTENHSLLELFEKKNTTVFIDDGVLTGERGAAVYEEYTRNMEQRMEKGFALPGQKNLLFTLQQVMEALSGYRTLALCTISQRQTLYKAVKKYHINSVQVNSYNNSFEALLKDLDRYKKNGYRVVLLSPSRSRAKRLSQDLSDNGQNAFYTEDTDREPQKGEVVVTYGRINRGFEYPLLGYVLISESDIFGQGRRKKRRVKAYEGQKISSFSDLSVGDFVVHENHGLGIYRGIEHIQVEGVTKDYLKIEYRDGGNLYILATDLGVIQKYASADAKTPKLNKLGGAEWGKTKSRVKTAVEGIARDLVELYAKRQQENGYVFGEDTVWQREFEEMFPYEETQDQLLAIEATKRDMESSKIMDRLICGDVGYGKTEIAIRAAFKAVQDSKQVAILCPTTILAQQHYNTIVQRLKDFPVRVDLMCRFRSAKEIKATLTDLKKGMVDIVVGTHRLLSKDVEYKDLGLLVVDEEQRFGVAHKEKIKKIRENIDVLTLTATPIPRTLHMSLVGIRDMSVLEEPPQDRMPIQTFVMEYNDELVREAISRELSRGGQVYYVYNRVNTIADVTANLKNMLPGAEIDFAHGQMKEEQLEQLMTDFVNGDIDVLVSTTIIETGLDIPNVNTIIIHDSDRFGLSQLYQLRGRVGRSNRTAYAFLMYKRDKILREEAQKRLSAIREFTDLGSGFKIAMKDLEIRGAGNILGQKQHGHMEAVGYDLYCKMLNEAVKKEKGIKVEDDFNTNIEIDLDAYIPARYVPSEMMKLDLYKRIATVESADEAGDILDEMQDRFGDIPAVVRNLVDISLMRVRANKVYVETISAKHKSIAFKFYKKARINPAGLMELLDKYEGALSFKNGETPTLVYLKSKTDTTELSDRVNELLDMMNALLV